MSLLSKASSLSPSTSAHGSPRCRAARAAARPALRCAAAHAARAAREPGGALAVQRRVQARLRPRAGARAAVAVHQRADRAARARARARQLLRVSSPRSGIRSALLRWESAAAARGARATPRALIPGCAADAASSVPARATRTQLARRALRGGRRRTRCGRHGMRVILCGGRERARARDRRGDRAARAAAARQSDRQGHAAAAAGTARARQRAPDAGLRARAHGDHGRHAGHRPVCRDQSGAQRAVPVAALVRRRLRRGGRARFRGVAAPQELPWTHKIEEPGVMDLISVERGHRQARRVARIRAMKDMLVPVSAGRAARQDHHPAHQGRAHQRGGEARQRAPRTGAARADLARHRYGRDRRRRRGARAAGRQRAALGHRGPDPRQGSARRPSIATSSSWRARSTSRTTSAPRSRSASTCSSARGSSKRSPTRPYR